jgi:ABC-type phosphate/phosphonate transport system substrate-binding protein
MIASLGMYDMDWVRGANDALWAGVAARLRAAGVDGVPERLDRDRSMTEIWHDSDLLLGQTCGYPLMTALRDVVQVVAAPVYDFAGCVGATHRSVLVVPAASPFRTLEDLRGGRVAINSADSNTGMNLLRLAVAPLAGAKPFFAAVTTTGAHLASIDLVARNGADLTAIDCVTFGLVARHRPDLVAGVRIIGETAPSPSLPFVARGSASPADMALLREALANALADPSLVEAKRALGLLRVEPATSADYEIVARYEREAAAMGYPVLV